MSHGHRRRHHVNRQINFLSNLFGQNSTPSSQPTAASAVDSPVAITPTDDTALSSSLSPSPTTSSSILSLTSSSSSLTTTSTTSTTLSTSSVISTTSTTTTQPPPSSASTSTLTFFRTVSSQPALNGTSSAHPSSTNSAVGGVSGGIVAGGILAVIVGSAGILFAALYFLRKSRRRKDEALAEEIWSRPDARRQSAMIPDEPGPIGPYNSMGAGSPRPPTMIERHMNSTPSMPSRQPTMPNMYSNNGYGNGYGATEYGQSTFYPGDIVTPTSTNPFISPYSQDVMASPVSSNVPDYHVPPPAASPVAPPLTMPGAAVVRQNTIPGGPHSPMVSSPGAANSHYVELSRSSVTPSQGMHYAEIAEKLHTPMPSVFAAVSAGPHDDAPSDLPPRDEDAPEESPFADSGTEHQVVDASRELDIEVPLPTPIMFQETRISSTPPSLPEIRVPDRSFSPVASFEFPVPLSARESPSPFSVEFSDVRTPPPAGLKFTSSPLATSTPTQAEPIPHEPKAEGESRKRPDTVYTLYDEEDAYGGI